MDAAVLTGFRKPIQGAAENLRAAARQMGPDWVVQAELEIEAARVVRTSLKGVPPLADVTSARIAARSRLERQAENEAREAEREMALAAERKVRAEVLAAGQKARAEKREAEQKARAQELDETLHVDLRLLKEAIRNGNAVRIRNLRSYLQSEAKKCGPEMVKRVERHLNFLFPSSSREPRLETQPRKRDWFVCRFCRSQYDWSAGIESKKGRVCSACHASVMCPSCHNRRQDGVDTCFKCNPNRGLSKTARPNPFRN